jgi:hypothetical protein
MGMPRRLGSRLALWLTTVLAGDSNWLSLPTAELGAPWALQLMTPSAPGVVSGDDTHGDGFGPTAVRLPPDPAESSSPEVPTRLGGSRKTAAAKVKDGHVYRIRRR